MNKDKFMLVLRIVQCLSNHKDVSITTFKKIPYVLQCCEIDLGLEFKSGINGPYASELNQFYDFININECGHVKIITVSDDFDIANYVYTEKEMYMANVVYKLFKRFANAIEAEMFAMLLERKIKGIDKPENLSRYDSDTFNDKRAKLYRIMRDFEKSIAPHLDNPWFK